MNLRKSLFWDTNYDKIDWEKNAPYVVDRVMHYGVWEEFKEMLKYYGREKVIEIVKNLRYMDRRVMTFCHVYFQIPLEEIRCYKIRQSMTLHWDY